VPLATGRKFGPERGAAICEDDGGREGGRGCKFVAAEALVVLRRLIYGGGGA
jgi:hypothetical protein